MIEWAISDGLTSYPHAMRAMQQRAEAIRAGVAPELIWLLEHPPLYTSGTSAKPSDLLQPNRFPVFEAGRGGQFTYHGPGQRIIYVMLDLKSRSGDVRAFIEKLERWITETLATFSVKGVTREGRVGIWVARPTLSHGREDKIAALGLRVSHGVTTHGISINVEPNLSHYDGIVPCGISDHGITSLADLGLPVSMTDVDLALRTSFERHFANVVSAHPPAPRLSALD